MKALFTLVSILNVISCANGECVFFKGVMCPLNEENTVGYDNDVVDVQSCQNL